MVLAEDRRRARFKTSLADIACDACGTVVDLDLRVKPRDPEAPSVWRCVGCSYDGMGR